MDSISWLQLVPAHNTPMAMSRLDPVSIYRDTIYFMIT